MKKGVIIFDFNRTLFDPEKNTLSEGALETLNYFSNKSFELILLGKGDSKRRKRVADLDIEKYFTEIHIVEEKSLAQLEGIQAKSEGVKIYSVGDRINKEIKLGNKFGFITIWFKNGKFSHETPKSEDEKPSFIISSLLELKNIINH